jgi:hypothetical protein
MSTGGLAGPSIGRVLVQERPRGLAGDTEVIVLPRVYNGRDLHPEIEGAKPSLENTLYLLFVPTDGRTSAHLVATVTQDGGVTMASHARHNSLRRIVGCDPKQFATVPYADVLEMVPKAPH